MPEIIDLDAIVAQRAEALGLDDGKQVPFKFKGEDFHVTHPMFLDDEVLDDLDTSSNPVDSAIIVLGEEQYARFRDLGGSASLVGILVQKINDEARDSTEGRPTRPSTSSRAQRKAPRRR